MARPLLEVKALGVDASKTILSFDQLRTLIVTGGDPEGLTGPSDHFDLVIAADSGFDHASALELKVDLVVGDFDSISPKARLGQVATEVHPRDKEHSDLELALDAALVRVQPISSSSEAAVGASIICWSMPQC